MPHSPLPRKVRHKKAVATPSAPIKLRDLARRTRLTVAQLETALAMPIDEILSLAADPIRAESLIGWFNEPGNIPAPPAKETPAISYREASVTVDGWRPYLTKSEYIVARFILDRTHRWSSKDNPKISERIPMRHFLEGVRDAEGQVWTEPCGLSERTIQRAINGLADKVALTVLVVANNQTRVMP